MDRGIFALWYDLPEDGEEEYLSWFHEVHLPELLSKREDYCWAAHYKNEGGGARFHEVVKDMMRAGESDVGSGKDYLFLIGAESPHSFFDPNFPQIKERQSEETKKIVSRRIGLNMCVFSEEARVDGPDAPNTRACPNCGVEGHRTDAKHCHACGDSLHASDV